MKTKKIEISVVVPIYNASKSLDKCLSSIFDQSATNWEALLIDDGSDDDSFEIARRYEDSDRRFRCLKTKGNQGAGAARNLGISSARGRYLAFLDADDFWHREKLRKQISFMEQKNYSFSCTAYIRKNISTGLETIIGVPEIANRKDILKTNTIGCSTVIYDRERLGLREMPLIRRRQDFVLWLELLEDIEHVHGLNIPLTTYNTGLLSLSSNKIKAAADTWSVYYNLSDLNLAGALWYFSIYATKGLLRNFFPKVASKLGWLHNVPSSD